MSLLFDLKHIRKCVWIWLQMSTFEVLTSNVHIWSSDFKCPHLKFWLQMSTFEVLTWNVHIWSSDFKCPHLKFWLQMSTFEVKFTRIQECASNRQLYPLLKSDKIRTHSRVRKCVWWYVRHIRKCEMPDYYSIWSETRIHAFADMYGVMWDTFANVKYQLTTRFEVRFTRVRKFEIPAYYSIWSQIHTRSQMWNTSLLLDLKWDTHSRVRECVTEHIRKRVNACESDFRCGYVRHICKCGISAFYSIWSEIYTRSQDVHGDMWDTFAHVKCQFTTRFEVSFSHVRKRCMVLCETHSHMWNASLLLDIAVKTQFAICIGYEHI